ncbi:MAG: hypothetical protein A2Z99_20995 [Treponema sp. GWB1_62_6]|nr:MAG: hypothetical protein A2Z99_20995 [Treponema sp. GWB1_62_6]OHE62876.1 MAG: hypothetical protein A2001_00285 [Treponema sp. GWC1_61_84]HCM26436.1 diguanylate cyclase response regulator [Treponema sp.]
MEPVILIVEDSMMFGRLLERSIINGLGFQTVLVTSYLETEKLLESGRLPIVALLDYCLPDALDGEIIDLCLKYQVPSIIMSSSFSDDLQESIWSKRVLDYIVKEGAQSIQYALDLIDRIVKNSDIGILIVDDSKVARNSIVQDLKPYRYQLYEAANGMEAFDILNASNGIKLVLTDYYMPVCDGFELTKKIRQVYQLDRLAIIGISSQSSQQLTIKFIKHGANDFLIKPFNREMLYCRINQNLKIVEHFDTLRQITHIDHLTNTSNRRYLFEAGDIIFEDSLRTGNFPIIAMIDIDSFKTINDTYSHQTGDQVIRTVAETLNRSIRKTDILSRYGGDEFCLICRNMDITGAPGKFEKWRKQVENLSFEKDGKTFHVTISIGLCLEKGDSFMQMIDAADKKLYEAKQAGRNQVCW